MMVNKFIIVVLVGVLLSCNGKQKSTDSSDQTSTGLQDSLTLALNEINNKSIIPGFAVAIIKDEKVFYKKGFGFANLKDEKAFTTKSINFLASISKTFIGVSIIKLVETGQLDLDEKINDILPYSIINPHYPQVPITVRHLVNHTAGLTDDFDPEEVGEADVILLEEINYEIDSIQAFMDNELSYYKLGIELTLDEVFQRYLTPQGRWYSEQNFEKFKPGTRYSYSNMGAELAARIIEIKSGMPFNQFTKKHIFEPLEMNNTGWFYSEVDSNLVTEIYIPNNWDSPTLAIEHPKYHYNAYPSGGLKSNMDDMSKYVIEMIKGSSGKGELLNGQSYKTLFEPVLDESYFEDERDSSPLNDEYDIGVFWAVSSTGIRLHNGGSIGVYSFMYFDPKTKSGAIGFCNLPDQSFGKIRNAVYRYERKIAATSK